MPGRRCCPGPPGPAEASTIPGETPGPGLRLDLRLSCKSSESSEPSEPSESSS